MTAFQDARTVIVTRTKDRPLLLKRAVDSVLSQDHGDWCHVIINDGGEPAAVRAVVEPRQEAYAGRLRILDNPTSLGMEGASDRAIAESRSEFLVIHDDDDSWDPRFLSTCVGFLEQTPHYGGVATRTRMVRERIEGETVIREGDEPFLHDVEVVTLGRMLRSNCITPISFLYRRACLEAVGPYCADLPVLGDWEFNVRFLKRFDIGLIDAPLAFYHVRPPSAGPMANSIHGGVGRHKEYEARLRNQWLREALAGTDPLTGLLSSTAEATPGRQILSMLTEDVRRQDHQIRMLDSLFRGQEALAESHEDGKAHGVRMLDALFRGQQDLFSAVADRLRAGEDLARAREAEIAALRAEIESMRESTSWAVTKPLRSLGRLFGSRGASKRPPKTDDPS